MKSELVKLLYFLMSKSSLSLIKIHLLMQCVVLKYTSKCKQEALLLISDLTILGLIITKLINKFIDNNRNNNNNNINNNIIIKKLNDNIIDKSFNLSMSTTVVNFSSQLLLIKGNYRKKEFLIFWGNSTAEEYELRENSIEGKCSLDHCHKNFIEKLFHRFPAVVHVQEIIIRIFELPPYSIEEIISNDIHFSREIIPFSLRKGRLLEFLKMTLPSLSTLLSPSKAAIKATELMEFNILKRRKVIKEVDETEQEIKELYSNTPRLKDSLFLTSDPLPPPFLLLPLPSMNNIRKNEAHKTRYRLKFDILHIWWEIVRFLLLILPSIFICTLSKSCYKYLRMLSSKRIPSQIVWLTTLAFTITALPIDLVHANSFNSDEMIYESNESDILIGNLTNVTVLPAKTPLFPTDLFTKEQLEHGAVVLHILGVIYMFVALAIVCDEFFVPSLDVIIEKLGITDDVAGATFMAAGGSAPELFTSVIGVFVSFDDVGIGTIVGSAVFNILFVIGMCALFSRTILTLTWWPLFRDCSFYSVSLIVLIYFFRDNLIYWWEALILFFVYIAYVGFMKWNHEMEQSLKKVIYKNKVTRVRSTDQLMPASNAVNSSETSVATHLGGSVTSHPASEARSGPSSVAGNNSNSTSNTVTGAKFRHGLLQLMIHTIDPLHDGKVDEKATQLHAIASLKVLLDATKPQRGEATTSAANHIKINLKETTLTTSRPNGNIDTIIDSGHDMPDESEALSMAWPSTGRKRLTYLLVAPIVFPLWITLPDTRTSRGKKFFPVTFIGSIMWIAAYSYLMVWWANVAGDVARIPPEVMGLTFLAAGTSIPDLITSVIVARKGFGDMAVSSSVGSNIFDVTVGLPIPWLLYGIIYQQPVEVNSVGMVCSITILFMMLLFVVVSIACFRWKMNKGLGLTMFFLYFVFVAVSLMFEYKIITCPV